MLCWAWRVFTASIQCAYAVTTATHNIQQYVKGDAHPSGSESFRSLLKRGCYGSIHWFFAKHMNRYLTELTGHHNILGERLRYRGLVA